VDELAVAGVELDAAVRDLAERFRAAHADVERRRQSGAIGFFELPWASDTSRAVKEVADKFGQAFENVVVLGIGGSGLGAITLRDALLAPLWNERDAEQRESEGLPHH